MARKDCMIIFDLDETLIHAASKRLVWEPDFIYDQFYVYQRPKLIPYLRAWSQDAMIGIWSAADDEYVNGVVQRVLDGIKDIEFELIWGRSKCWIKEQKSYNAEGLKEKRYTKVKPLSLIKADYPNLNRIMIFDDTASKVNLSGNDFRLVVPFFGDPKDKELDRINEILVAKVF